MADRVTPTAVVTGAASGIGAAIANRLARAGYRVVLVDRDESGLRARADTLAAAPGGHECVAMDVAHAASWRRLAETITHDGADVALSVHAAGVLAAGPLAETDPELISRLVEVNLTGVLLGFRALAPLQVDSLKRAEHATSPALPRGVMAVASIFASVAPPWFAAYSASKAGVVAATESLRGELRPHGLSATAVLPGVTRTGLFGAARYTREDVQQAVTGYAEEATLSADDVAEQALRHYARRRAVATIGGRAGRFHLLKRLFGQRVTDAVAKKTLDTLGGAESASREP